jgi:AraC family transcriptional regulator of adaptative response / DNA-3-methyladenine glycosylase II
MTLDSKRLYKALLARDARFDGLFYVGVTSTRIYCRPVCPVKPPQERNCRFFRSAQEAEQARFRPCLRCRPELAPGNAPVDHAQRIAHLIVQRIEEGMFDEKTALETMADEFELSSRQLRRIVHKELGVAPLQLIATRRLLLAKQLLTETNLPVTEIAFASGFSSLRRFNDAFVSRYRTPPTRLRKKAAQDATPATGTVTLTLQLSYRPPYDWAGLLAFLKARQLKGVEWVTDDFYARTTQLGGCKGWLKVTQAKKQHALLLELTHSLAPVLPGLLGRVRDLFDLSARPDVIAGHLCQDELLAARVQSSPGLRVPGAFHGFEMGLRAILGQQVTVKAATTLAGRLAEAFGEPIATPFPELSRLTPAPPRLARASVSDIARLGIVSARCKSLIALAQAQLSGRLSLEAGNHHSPEKTMERLAELPGVGQWTAHYIAMRALRWPDAFPSGDIAMRKTLGGISARQAEELSQAWRPWRSYAVLHLWRNHPALSSAPSPRQTNHENKNQLLLQNDAVGDRTVKTRGH